MSQDIGGTDFWTVGLGANAGWLSMAEYADIVFYVTIGATWNAADQLDDLHLEQATDAVGTGAKVIAGRNLDQTAANAAGETFSLDCKSEDLDVDGGFTHVRCMIAEGGNTGQDDVSCTYIRTTGRFLNANESGCTATV